MRKCFSKIVTIFTILSFVPSNFSYAISDLRTTNAGQNPGTRSDLSSTLRKAVPEVAIETSGEVATHTFPNKNLIVEVDNSNPIIEGQYKKVKVTFTSPRTETSGSLSAIGNVLCPVNEPATATLQRVAQYLVDVLHVNKVTGEINAFVLPSLVAGMHLSAEILAQIENITREMSEAITTRRYGSGIPLKLYGGIFPVSKVQNIFKQFVIDGDREAAHSRFEELKITAPLPRQSGDEGIETLLNRFLTRAEALRPLAEASFLAAASPLPAGAATTSITAPALVAARGSHPERAKFSQMKGRDDWENLHPGVPQGATDTLSTSAGLTVEAILQEAQDAILSFPGIGSLRHDEPKITKEGEELTITFYSSGETLTFRIQRRAVSLEQNQFHPRKFIISVIHNQNGDRGHRLLSREVTIDSVSVVSPILRTVMNGLKVKPILTRWIESARQTSVAAGTGEKGGPGDQARWNYKKDDESRHHGVPDEPRPAVLTEAEIVTILTERFKAWANVTRGSPEYGLRFHEAVIALETLIADVPRWEGLVPQAKAAANIAKDSQKNIDDIVNTVLIKRNVKLVKELVRTGHVPKVIGLVNGPEAQQFWQAKIDETARTLGRNVLGFSLAEDLPVNQAFGLLYMWHNLRRKLEARQLNALNLDILFAFVFGSGSRSTPFTENEAAQKPALQIPFSSDGHYFSAVEMAMTYFIAVEQHLKRSGFNGVVVKWGDEVQIPVADLSGTNDLFRDADIVRFVSVQEMTPHTASNKDWVGIDRDSKVTMFIPRRPIEEMRKLAAKGLIQERDGKLYGGINLGSIAVSYGLLTALLDEFGNDVLITGAKREDRPDLDPQFFTALCIAAIADPRQREETWQEAITTSTAMENLNAKMPDVLQRIRKALDTFETENKRPVKMVAMDFIDQYWADLGQHKSMFDFFTMINRDGPEAEVARAIAGIESNRDENGNIFIGHCEISPEVTVRDSILINAKISGRGTINNCVLVETEIIDIEARNAFDFQSIAPKLILENRAGTYKCVSDTPIHAGEKMRLTTLFLPDGAKMMQVNEDADLRDKEIYGTPRSDGSSPAPVYGNTITFYEAHRLMAAVPYTTLENERQAARQKVRTAMKALQAYRENPRPLKLQCVTMTSDDGYNWGDSDYIPSLLGIANPERIDHPIPFNPTGVGLPIPLKEGPKDGSNPERTLYAELWIGAHPKGPARAKINGAQVDLGPLIKSVPEQILGEEIAQRFKRMPFLLKVLTAKKPLALKVHPTKKQAEEGLAREEKLGVPLDDKSRNYFDANHKPEIVSALTDCYMLIGVRPLADVKSVLRRVPEFKLVISKFEETPRTFAKLFNLIIELPQKDVDGILKPLIERLSRENDEHPFTEKDREYWFLRAAADFTGQDGSIDRGLFGFYFLNLVHLKPSEAAYIPAGQLHSFLEGASLHDAASSDNNIRGGLTDKYVDKADLMRIINLNSFEPEILTPQPVSETEKIYLTPSREFLLSEINITPQKPHIREKDKNNQHSVDMLLVMEGKVTLTVKNANYPPQTFKKGETFMIPAACEEYEISGEGKLYKSSGRPRERLKFGTSGLRDFVVNMTDMEVYINTKGYIQYLFDIGDIKPGEEISLAGDLRPSTDRITRAVIRAIEDMGCKVDYCGKIPTPAVAYYAKLKGRACIMVTGSHVPKELNGIKYYKKGGNEVLKTEEKPILAAVEKVRDDEYVKYSQGRTIFDENDMLQVENTPDLPSANEEAERLYIERYTSVFSPDTFKGRRIGVYQHSAVGRDIMVKIFKALGAEVVEIERSNTFIPVDSESLPEGIVAKVKGWIDEYDLDAVVSGDGDTDRPLLFDEKGRFLWGDSLGLVVAQYLGADFVAVPISSNDAICQVYDESHRALTKIGSPYIIQAMIDTDGETDERGEKKYKKIMGWERNGGFLTQSDLEINKKRLTSLPTRDAVFPLICALDSIRRQETRRMSEVVDGLPPRFSASGSIKPFPVTISRKIVSMFTPDKNSNIKRVSFKGDSGEVVYYKFTGDKLIGQEYLDGETKEFAKIPASQVDRLREIKNELKKYFTTQYGFGEITGIDFLDGIRVTFRNNAVAHPRPSGNAPEFRAISNGDTRDDADSIVGVTLATLIPQIRRDIGGQTPPSSSTPARPSPTTPAVPSHAVGAAGQGAVVGLPIAQATGQRAVKAQPFATITANELKAELGQGAAYRQNVINALEGIETAIKENTLTLKISRKFLGFISEENREQEETRIKEDLVRAINDSGLLKNKTLAIEFVEISPGLVQTGGHSTVCIIGSDEIDNFDAAAPGQIRVLPLARLTKPEQILVLPKAVFAAIALRNLTQEDAYAENGKAEAVRDLLNEIKISVHPVTMQALRVLTYDLHTQESLKRALEAIVSALPMPVAEVGKDIDQSFADILEAVGNI